MNLLQRFSSKLILITLSLLFTSHLYAATDAQIPSKGLTQEQVKQQFGEPKSVGATVGIPPITRWDYDNYTVVFEGQYVIHSFLHKKLMGPKLNPTPKVIPPTTTETVEVKEELPEVEEIIETETEISEETIEQKVDEVVVEEAVIEEVKEVVVEEVVSEEKVEEVIPPSAPETVVEEVAPAEAETEAQEAQMETEQEDAPKDLNFEEAPQDGEFGKWGY